MRCVSKCFVGGRSLRVYSLLFLGMIFGFSLSTILQTLDIGTLRTTAGLKVQEPLSHHHRDLSRVAFSNLKSKQPSEEGEPEFGGDYGYDRDSETNQKRGKEPMAEGSKVPVSAASAEPIKVKMKGSLRESVDGLPVNKLSEELTTRETLLIAVITSITQLMTQTLAIQGTWAPGAAQVVYFVGEVDTMPHLPQGMKVVKLEGVADQESWELKEIFVVKYLIDRFLDRADWFMLIGDQTYLVTDHLESRLNSLDAASPVYLGLPGEASGNSLLCRRDPGVVYSRAVLESLRAYLPMCWPGGQGEGHSLSGCVSAMGLKCTRAAEVSHTLINAPSVPSWARRTVQFTRFLTS